MLCFQLPKEWHGKFVNHHWYKIVEMSELKLFYMCLPKNYIIEVLIPETSKGVKKPMDLHEFYVWHRVYVFYVVL